MKVGNVSLKKKIMVVEDEPAYQNILKYYLEKNNFTVIQAWDGEEAVLKIKKYKPDLIILDVNLPKLNGYEVCKKIRENKDFKEVPIFFLTVRRKDIEKITGLEIGGDAYLDKPFKPSEIVLRIKNILKKKGEKND